MAKAVKDVIVVAHCTGKLGLVDVYEHQLKAAGIDTCFEIRQGKATPSWNMRERLADWRATAERFKDYQMIIVTDAWDVMFFGTKDELMSKLARFVISSERNCAPEDHYAGQIVSDKPCKFANCGMMAGSPAEILVWIEKAEKLGDLDFLLSTPGADQAWFNRRLIDHPEVVILDDTTNLFYVVSWADGHLEDSSLKLKDGRLWNSTFDTYPNFFHFAGHGPNEPLRILPGEGEPRYETQRLAREMMKSLGWHSCTKHEIVNLNNRLIVTHP